MKIQASKLEKSFSEQASEFYLLVTQNSIGRIRQFTQLAWQLKYKPPKQIKTSKCDKQMNTS